MTATTTTTAPVIFSARKESKVVQVMSDIWEEFSFFTTNELVNGEFVNKSVVADGQPMPEVNATEADIAKARISLRKQGKQAILNSLAWVETPSAGCFVEVVRGRKVPKGSRGLILKSGTNNFGKWFLIRFRDGSKNFVSAGNCEVEFPLPQENMEAIAFAAAEDELVKAVNDLSFEGIRKAADTARLAVNLAARGVRDGRLQFV